MIMYKVKGYFVTYVHGKSGTMVGLTFRDGSVTRVKESEADAILYDLNFIPIHEPLNFRVHQLYPGTNVNVLAEVITLDILSCLFDVVLYMDI
jgi:hypothetical protein